MGCRCRKSTFRGVSKAGILRSAHTRRFERIPPYWGRFEQKGYLMRADTKDNAFYDVHAALITWLLEKKKEIVMKVMTREQQERGNQNCSNAPCLNKARLRAVENVRNAKQVRQIQEKEDKRNQNEHGDNRENNEERRMNLNNRKVVVVVTKPSPRNSEEKRSQGRVLIVSVKRETIRKKRDGSQSDPTASSSDYD